MALLNIGAGNSDDAFYRYRMPKMITKVEGRGNGIKTNIVNMVDVAKALARPASYTTKYFRCGLGARSKFDEKTGISLVNGSHDTAKLARLLENFINKYVQCYGCGNPETEIFITKNQMIKLNCVACGFVSDVDMMDKLTSFILRNRAEPKKRSDKKAMKRAEKERPKKGEAAAAAADDVQWQTDTSMEAARQRIKEQLTVVTADMVMLSTLKKPKVTTKASNKGQMIALLEALFEGIEKGFAKEVIKKKNYLAVVAKDKGSLLLLLKAIESFCGKANSNALKEVALVLKTLYDVDVLEEEYVLQWHQQGLIGKNKGSQIWKNVKPFIDWLQSAESESEEE
ncbi:hypothetical protein ES319_A07G083200v1 [Gossypium barbadense]|uniref:W2 domain-containing protein n=1 Tax=Gossypium barbadense TaxID=3634 RepID=A0A5J5V1G2_GOSBA|nr:hypothetical protein ES319_A07G083200v1 [Gossypium barbadense]